MSETLTLTLTEFLLARIAEDERPHGCSGGSAGGYEPTWCTTHRLQWGHAPVSQSPRVLAECEAKLRILEIHAQVPARPEWIKPDGPTTGCLVCHWSEDFIAVSGSGPCDTIKALAPPYADHPDFREEWRP